MVRSTVVCVWFEKWHKIWEVVKASCHSHSFLGFHPYIHICIHFFKEQERGGGKEQGRREYVWLCALYCLKWFCEPTIVVQICSYVRMTLFFYCR